MGPFTEPSACPCCLAMNIRCPSRMVPTSCYRSPCCIERRKQPNAAGRLVAFASLDVVHRRPAASAAYRACCATTARTGFTQVAVPGPARHAVPRRGRGLLPEPELRANPVWFVMWRVDDEDPSRAWPEARDPVVQRGRPPARRAGARRQPAAAGRRCANGCRPLPTNNYQPEPKQRRRPASFVRARTALSRQPMAERATTVSCRAGRGARPRCSRAWRRPCRHAPAPAIAAVWRPRWPRLQPLPSESPSPPPRRPTLHRTTPPVPAPLTLEDVAQLTPAESDFGRFVAPRRRPAA